MGFSPQKTNKKQRDQANLPILVLQFFCFCFFWFCFFFWFFFFGYHGNYHSNYPSISTVTLQGSHSTTDERGAAALHATRIDSEVGWSSHMVRVVQGKEPLHFLRCFGRRITILQGGVDSGFKNQQAENGHSGIFGFCYFVCVRGCRSVS